MASRGFPSMTALLALLAIAGYQNRDKIADMLGKARRGRARSSRAEWPRRPARPARRRASAGGVLSGGLGELLDRFKQNGQGETAEFVGRNRPEQAESPPSQLEQAIGPDVLDTLSQQTGLSRQELLARLTRELPDAVDKYTPQGRLPTEAEFRVPDRVGFQLRERTMGIIWTIIIGFVAGVIAKFIMPGDNEPSGFILTTILGIAGAFLATWLGQALGWYGPNEGAGFIGAIVGAIIVLAGWAIITRQRTTTV